MRVLRSAAPSSRLFAENQLPVNFFVRVIWQESRFNPLLVGRKYALPNSCAKRRTSADLPIRSIRFPRSSALFGRDVRQSLAGSCSLPGSRSLHSQIKPLLLACREGAALSKPVFERVCGPVHAGGWK
jgi:hypothetical protein